MKKNYQHSAGFTLIEILAVMMVFGIIGGIAAATLITTLRTSSKSTILTTVKQNGDYTISQIAKIIRNAYAIKSPTFPCGSPNAPTQTTSISVLDGTGNISTIACTGANPVAPIPANTITLQTGGAAPTSLLDTSLVQTHACSFTCSQADSGQYPVIGISFSLLQLGSNAFVEQIASSSAINFSTSIVFRNYQR